MTARPADTQRLRAPSKRSLETRARIFDAAEQQFALHGFEGASIRDIAQRAGVTGALVSHHGGGKVELFEQVVARRADALARLRIEALNEARAEKVLELRDVLTCFVAPFLDKVLHDGSQWQAYGRLIAHVSSDQRWHALARVCFDPTAKMFLNEISVVLPGVPKERLSAGFVFMVSAMLSLCEAQWRIATLSETPDVEGLVDTLLDFCEAGFRAV